MCRGCILLRVRDMSHSYTWRDSWSRFSSYMWHGSFAVIPLCRLDIHRVKWRINMWHDSSIHVKWLRVTVQLIYATWMIHSDMLWRYSPCSIMHSCVTHSYTWRDSGSRFSSYTQYKSFTSSSQSSDMDPSKWYGVALVSRIDQIVGLFCKRAL